MNQTLRLTIYCFLFLSSANIAWTKNAEPIKSSAIPCGVLTKFDGDIQILDANRTDLLPVKHKVSIPCGAWITLKSGYAEIKHRHGFTIKLGPNTLVEIFDNTNNRHMTYSDHLVLFKGVAFVDVKNGSGEFRIVTPNARARLKSGKCIMIYSNTDEESQLIALQKSATLENRFENSRKIKVLAGEATSLNFKYLRVVPSTPKTVSIASLKLHLNGLPLNSKEFHAAMDSAVKRARRTFAHRVSAKSKNKAKRLLASTAKYRKKSSKKKKRSFETYVRHKSYPDDALANEQWLMRIVGNDPEGKKFLFPSRGLAGNSKEKVFLEGLNHKNNPKWVKEEKNRLIKKIRNIEFEN